VHASPKWSKDFLEIKNDYATQLLLGELRSIFGSRFSNACYKVSHRWRYARTTRPLMKTYLCSADKSLFIGGDWCLGARVENAYESGFAIAKAFIDNKS
jgi:predicted NAD/FAD-dependent oxidoreductase